LCTLKSCLETTVLSSGSVPHDGRNYGYIARKPASTGSSNAKIVALDRFFVPSPLCSMQNGNTAKHFLSHAHGDQQLPQ
jgi:hypothetical protein